MNLNAAQLRYDKAVEEYNQAETLPEQRRAEQRVKAARRQLERAEQQAGYATGRRRL